MPMTNPHPMISEPTPSATKPNRLSRAMRLSMFLDEILSLMEHHQDPKTGNHKYRTVRDIVITDEFYKIMQGSMYPKSFIKSR